MITKQAKIVDLDTILWEISECRSKFFSVLFKKRTTGELREMVCRRGVKKGVKGVGAAYDAAEKKLITVWSSADNGFRNIPIEGIVSAKIGGIEYVVRGKENAACNSLVATNSAS